MYFLSLKSLIENSSFISYPRFLHAVHFLTTVPLRNRIFTRANSIRTRWSLFSMGFYRKSGQNILNSQSQATCSSFRMVIWRFIEDPQSSVPAAIFALLSILFVFASVIGKLDYFEVNFFQVPLYLAAYYMCQSLWNFHRLKR